MFIVQFFKCVNQRFWMVKEKITSEVNFAYIAVMLPVSLSAGLSKESPIANKRLVTTSLVNLSTLQSLKMK